MAPHTKMDLPETMEICIKDFEQIRTCCMKLVVDKDYKISSLPVPIIFVSLGLVLVMWNRHIAI